MHNAQCTARHPLPPAPFSFADQDGVRHRSDCCDGLMGDGSDALTNNPTRDFLENFTSVISTKITKLIFWLICWRFRIFTLGCLMFVKKTALAQP